MSKDTFTWHPDQDDVYEGAVYGRTMLHDLPFGAFSKDVGKSFTMNGEDADSLTLSPTPSGGAAWHQSSRFDINGGTLAINPPHYGGVLLFGDDSSGPDQNVILNIRGAFVVNQINIIGRAPSAPCTINLYARGQCRITGSLFSGSFAINVNDSGSMSVSAHSIEIDDGTYFANGVANEESPSIELIALRSLANLQSGYLAISRHEFVCKSASVSRLRAMSMSLAETHIRAEESASLLVACDSIDVDSGTVFAVGQGSAVMTFTGSEKNAAPFDFFNNAYPKGLFNFITTEGINKSTFRFLNVGNSAYDFKKMQTDGVITIDGAPDTQSKCDWRSEVDGPDKYFAIFLK